jgi:hypothetical protein
MTAISDFQAAMASAAGYVGSGDYDAARRQVIMARIYLAQIPNSAADGVSAQWREDLSSIEQSISTESGRTTRSVSAACEFKS